MRAWSVPPYHNTVAALATQHGKERVIAPVFERGLGLRVALAMGVDTDRFGAFNGGAERTVTALEAARAKIAAAFEYAPHAAVGIASEGSFGLHPSIPFLPQARELVLLIDRERGVEIAGHDVTSETSYGARMVTSLAEAAILAERAGFPTHGLIVIGAWGGRPAPDLALFHEIETRAGLKAALRETLALCGAAYLEADMRAHRNPMRMQAIERAALDLVRRFKSYCPTCGHPGFDVAERVPGLPCEGCGAPTEVCRAEILACETCGCRLERPATPTRAAAVELCGRCGS